MLTVRVSDDCVMIKVAERRAREQAIKADIQPKESRQRLTNAEKIDPEIADAITRWSLGGPGNVVVSAEPETQSAALFRAETREMIIYEDRVTLCGAEVWRDCGQTDLRDALAYLSEKKRGAYVRIKGTRLSEEILGRNASNHIGKPLSCLCSRITEVMEEQGLDCGREDVIRNFAGGYHFRDWIVVRLAGDWATALGIEPESPATETGEPSDTPAEPGLQALNERQRWLLDQVRGGERLKLADVLEQFRKQCNRSTINRDVKDLRDRGLMKTGPDGYYTSGGQKEAE